MEPSQQVRGQSLVFRLHLPVSPRCHVPVINKLLLRPASFPTSRTKPPQFLESCLSFPLSSDCSLLPSLSPSSFPYSQPNTSCFPQGPRLQGLFLERSFLYTFAVYVTGSQLPLRIFAFCVASSKLNSSADICRSSAPKDPSH